MASDGGRKFVVAAIFLWFVHTWMTIVYIPHHPTSDAPFLGPGHVGGGAPGPAPPASSSSSASSRGFDLAREQSDGFFDDVADAHWRTLQKHHAALFPNYYDNLYRHSHGPDDRGNYAKLRHSAEWYGQNFQVEFVCPLMRRLPADGMSDGPKWVSVFRKKRWAGEFGRRPPEPWARKRSVRRGVVAGTRPLGHGVRTLRPALTRVG